MMMLITDVDFWMVLVSLVITAAALGMWIRDAGDDWMSLLDTSPEPGHGSGRSGAGELGEQRSA